MNNSKHILLSARWKVQDGKEGQGEAGGWMGSHLWKRSDPLHRLTQPNSSLEKLTGQEASLRMEELFREAEKRLN